MQTCREKPFLDDLHGLYFCSQPVSFGKSSINGGCTVAMVDDRRVKQPRRALGFPPRTRHHQLRGLRVGARQTWYQGPLRIQESALFLRMKNYVCCGNTYVCMDGWMDGWMDGCMHACMHACMYVCMYIACRLYMDILQN